VASPLRWLRTLAIGVTLIAVLLVALLARWGGREYQRRVELYWYDVERSYHYAFTPAQAVPVPVSLEADGLEWPQEAVACGTAFLRVEMDGAFSGRWFEPAIAASSPAGSVFAQHFERGGRGTRWLNLSPLCDDGSRAGDRIALQGEHLSWRAGASELLLFEDPPLDAGPLLVVAPHPDDAEIAAFGLYRDRDAAVVTVTAGDYENRRYAHLAPGPAGLRRTVGRARTWDSLVVPIWGGVPADRSANLGYLTGTLDEMQSAPGAEAGTAFGGTEAVRGYRSANVSPLARAGDAASSWPSLVADFSHLLRELQPATIAAPHPLLDVSSDHRLATLALLEALEEVGDRQARLLLYNNHHVHAEYYPFGPADSLVTLPPWFAERSRLAFGGVYSHPLDEATVMDKTLALGMMHDLKEPPRRQLGEATMRGLRRIRRVVLELWRDLARYYSYYRRAARPNELFFAVEPEDRDALHEATRELQAR
jgi:LmbE family N-acetylglucosaminyl deacetylase